ncbi:hypothetical protein [Allokutzneria albata]|uniref:Uncharacterized protein n=1 Tax=Allokutzneria albata TaxID=211114 RepID=A0A1G9RDB5_ALLAB|nr:hypothetical protein [Allokutzneria albata]SDM21214.1 hypothetical protein SAMN04489726_0388 [Allokutzneria albata]
MERTTTRRQSVVPFPRSAEAPADTHNTAVWARWSWLGDEPRETEPHIVRGSD